MLRHVSAVKILCSFGALGAAWSCDSHEPNAQGLSPSVTRASSCGDLGPETSPPAPEAPSQPSTHAPEAPSQPSTLAPDATSQPSAGDPEPPSTVDAVNTEAAGSSSGDLNDSPPSASAEPSATSAPSNSLAGGEPDASTSTATCPSSGTLSAGNSSQSLDVDGRARSFVVHVPPNYDGTTALPVVVDFHPLGGSGEQWQGSTPWAAKADSEGFIMVWPSGIDGSWNAGRCCRTAFEQDIDDVAFARAIVDWLSAEGCIDHERIYATGCSNGGGMAFRVGCDAADVFAGIAPVDFDCATGDSANPTCGNCAPARPIQEIQFRATGDTAVPYEGGLRTGGTTEHGGAEKTLSEWGEINECTGQPEAVPDKAECRAFTSCGDGVDTMLCTVQGGSHCGNYASFGIVDFAWQRFAQASAR